MAATNLTLYTPLQAVKRARAPRIPKASERFMKTTMMFRPIANPRRTTLAHLKDAEPLSGAEQAAEPEGADVVEAPSLPQQTANPRRTVLMKAPGEE
jgi:hypothetical protein